MDLRDDGESIPLQAVDDPHLPERLPAIQELGDDPPAETLQLSFITRVGKVGMPQVVVEVEGRIIDPDRIAFDRDELHSLAIAGDPMKPGGHVATDALEVDAAAVG